jgi:hypothetical protein
MKEYCGTFKVENDEGKTVLEAAGSTEDTLTTQFGKMAAEFEKGMADESITNMAQAIDAFSKFDFFYQHMMTAGLLFFFENYNRGAEMLKQMEVPAKSDEEEKN